MPRRARRGSRRIRRGLVGGDCDHEGETWLGSVRMEAGGVKKFFIFKILVFTKAWSSEAGRDFLSYFRFELQDGNDGRAQLYNYPNPPRKHPLWRYTDYARPRRGFRESSSKRVYETNQQLSKTELQDRKCRIEFITLGPSVPFLLTFIVLIPND